MLLSIGYSACHWCHVMAHESFEDAAPQGPVRLRHSPRAVGKWRTTRVKYSIA
ncbi:hypothetical protein CKO22_09215 [Thiococcus pfennigii]|nr:hypothetical protein [Thiococcus pfennigii]